ncbi:MAG: sigma-70 family RNA polymerase sigma factor [Acidobacteria bacterium]|nr:sigma-70 family RNA polymerase sigma factor [Acidobacteriota bacterium]
MDDLQKEIGKSREQLAAGGSPMTTLTLSAGSEIEIPDVEIGAGIDVGTDQEKTAPVDCVSGDSGNSMDQRDDHALLEATRTGDKAAFDEIVRRYRNQITNYVYRMLNDYDGAVDMAQETFLRVYKNADRYQATYSFSTYIYRIAHNLAISEIRQRKRRKTIQLPTFHSEKDNEEVEVELPDQRLVLADHAMIDDERRRAVARGIASLPEKYRAAIVLCDIEEKSYEEISGILRLPVGTVKSRINRARNLLKEKLREYL